MLLPLLLMGLIDKEEYYNLQDGDGRCRLSNWRLIMWLMAGKNPPAYIVGRKRFIGMGYVGNTYLKDWVATCDAHDVKDSITDAELFQELVRDMNCDEATKSKIVRVQVYEVVIAGPRYVNKA